MVHLKINLRESPSLTPSTLHLEVTPQSTIFHLKQRIQADYPVFDTSRQILQYNGNTLDDSRVIESYGFQDNDVVDVKLSRFTTRLPTDVFRVQILGIQDFVLQVQGTMQVKHVKFLISEEWGASSYDMKLVHVNERRGIRQEMNDENILHQYRIDRDSAIEASLEEKEEVPLRHPSEIFMVQILGIEDFVLEVQGTMRVEHVKFLISQECRVSKNGMKLFHVNERKGIHEEMDDDDIVHQYNIDRDSAIEVTCLEVNRD